MSILLDQKSVDPAEWFEGGQSLGKVLGLGKSLPDPSEVRDWLPDMSHVNIFQATVVQ